MKSVSTESITWYSGVPDSSGTYLVLLRDRTYPDDVRIMDWSYDVWRSGFEYTPEEIEFFAPIPKGPAKN